MAGPSRGRRERDVAGDAVLDAVLVGEAMRRDLSVDRSFR
jgi:hypothetical protein